MPLFSNFLWFSVSYALIILRLAKVVKRFADILLRFSVVFFIIYARRFFMVNVERLKEAKKKKKITFDELSAASGVPISTIYDIFRGVTADPRAGTLEAIERALGLGLDDTAREEITVQEYRLLTAFRELDDTTRELVVLLVEKIGGSNSQ